MKTHRFVKAFWIGNLLVLALSLAACASSAPSIDQIQTAIVQTQMAIPSTPTPEPTPTPQLSCDGSLCIKDVRTYILDSLLVVEFQLVNTEGEVNFGEDIAFSKSQMIGLHLVQSENDDGEFLAAFDLPANQFTCYQGNDVPWANREMVSICSFSFPVGQLQKSVKVGDLVKVEDLNHGLIRTTTVMAFEE